ncbi:MAG TPA: glycosyltransferase family A protein [Pseudolabrys sp.]|nr:glycosyltransferase family A protein [Pseudolabrys sp.]
MNRPEPTSPTVSVIIPVFNRTELLRRSLASLEAQTFRDFEVIVVDDGSADNVGLALGNMPYVTLIRHEHQRGAAAARNTGVQHSKSAYIAFLDSDDEWLPDKLERQIDFMKGRQPARDVSCTAYLLQRAGTLHERPVNTNSRLQIDFLWGCTISPGSTLMAQRAVYDRVGPFDERLRRLEDWDWMLRCSRQYDIDVLPEPLVRIFASPQTAVGDEVANALALMSSEREKYGITWRHPGSVLKFRSTISLERAALHYRRGDTWGALKCGCLSLLIYPFRDRLFWTRMLNHLRDVLQGKPFK